MPWNATLGLVVLAAASLILQGQLTARLIDRAPKPGTVDRVTAQERRLEAIRLQLPDRGVVGYTISRPAGKDDWKRYGRMLTQYALAPVLVEEGTAHQMVVEDVERGVRVVGHRRAK